MTTRLIMTREDGAATLEERAGAVFTLPEEDSHYLTRVLRFSEGAQLIVVNPESGAELTVRITDAAKVVSVEVLSVVVPPPLNTPVATLLYPLTKGSTIELVLEKGCELGVPRFFLWQAERSVVRLGDQREQEKKLVRWRKILRAASQQSEKNLIPSLSIHSSLRSALAELGDWASRSEVSLLCSLDQAALPIAQRVIPGRKHHLIVGPEGDFTPEEEKLLVSDKFARTSLGPCRLRAETAAIAAVAMTSGIAGFSFSPLAA